VLKYLTGLCANNGGNGLHLRCSLNRAAVATSLIFGDTSGAVVFLHESPRALPGFTFDARIVSTQYTW